MSEAEIESGLVDVVVLDDDLDFRNYIEDLLRDEGKYSVRSFGDETTLFASIQDRVPEIVLLDMKMGATSGESVVEELLWLRRSWLEAFTGRTAAIFRVADWHDRQRPGVVARIRGMNGGVCSLDQHERGAEQDRRPPTVPIAGAATRMAAWWTAGHHDGPPYPTDDEIAEAVGRR